MNERKRIVGSVTDEGEIIEGAYAVIPKRRQNGFTKGWFAMANDATGELINLVLDRTIQARDLLVLLAMLEVLELENYIRISQRHLADRLQMKAPNVSRSIKALVEAGILLTGPKVGQSTTYRLAPSFGWKGSADNHRAALKTMRQRMTAANIRGVIEGRDPQTVDMFSGKTDNEQPCTTQPN